MNRLYDTFLILVLAKDLCLQGDNYTVKLNEI